MNYVNSHLVDIAFTFTMLVTLISQCEKGALSRTRLILDSFAERIGDHSWQTLITEQGLETLHMELRKTASKSTAVACHYHRSRTRSQLLWIVGKKHEFNAHGQVPVNETAEANTQFMDKEQWKYLEIMKAAVGIAGLFHDFGKANDLFQRKLSPETKSKSNSEPLRHEWISLHLFDSFILGCTSDHEWLNRLEEISAEPESLSKDALSSRNYKLTPNITAYPRLAELVAWLILSHHKLPIHPYTADIDLDNIDKWIESHLAANWNSPQIDSDDDADRLKLVSSFSKGLPCLAKEWRRKARSFAELADKALTATPISFSLLEQRFTSHLSRMALMLADHHYSQGKAHPEYQSDNYTAIANTDKKWKQPMQHLDEHNIGVALAASEIIAHLPEFKSSLAELEIKDNSMLEQMISKNAPQAYEKFGWQNATIKTAKKIRKESPRNGFFGVNMASTGKGKTIANAKIMYALGSRRFNVAIGLRTLTLQTGTSFLKDLNLDNNQLATLVGGIAVKELYEIEQGNTEKDEYTGSESADELTDFTVEAHSNIDEPHALSKWTRHDDKIEKLLSAPILVSTIDHLIPATEGIRGGKQIGPMLRLLTSDLILDEPDDFGLEDLPALSRLVNWAGMLGRKVLLSSATMPPSLITALFIAYQKGRADYLEVNASSSDSRDISCAWFDEFESTHTTISAEIDFCKQHKNFITSRIKALNAAKILKRGSLLNVPTESQDKHEILSTLAQTIFNGALSLHEAHAIKHEGKTLSVGLVRMANIDPLVAVARLMMEIDTPTDTQLHYCIYHSRFPLAVRSDLETRLDGILKRTDEKEIWDHPDVKGRINKHKNHIFIVLASPVAEVGRDHDYDWAIAEPSSMRSIIQLAGRVLRHRPDKVISEDKPNILILQKNFKGLQGVSPCFLRPGFESSRLRTESSDLSEILSSQTYQVINSCERIRFKTEQPEKTLGELEHQATLEKLLKDHSKDNPCIAKNWWIKQPTWCGNLQSLERFRNSKVGDRYCLMMTHEDDSPTWQQINPQAINKNKIYVNTDDIQNIGSVQISSHAFWFDLTPETVMKNLKHKHSDNSLSYESLCKRFAEVTLVNYSENKEQPWQYHPQLGIFNEI